MDVDCTADEAIVSVSSDHKEMGLNSPGVKAWINSVDLKAVQSHEVGL